MLDGGYPCSTCRSLAYVSCTKSAELREHIKNTFLGIISFQKTASPQNISFVCWFPLCLTLTKSSSSLRVCHCTSANPEMLVSVAEFHDCWVAACVHMFVRAYKYINQCLPFSGNGILPFLLCIFHKSSIIFNLTASAAKSGFRSETGGILPLTVTPSSAENPRMLSTHFSKIHLRLRSFCHSSLCSLGHGTGFPLNFPPFKKHITRGTTSQC